MAWLDSGFRAAAGRSEAIGIAPFILCVAGWVGLDAAVARTGAGALHSYPLLAQGFVIIVAIVVAMGGLAGLWIAADRIDYRRRGYRVRWLTGQAWRYEERTPGGSVECLPFSCEVTRDGYPADCEVLLQSEARWELEAPRRALGRRAEILQRIAELLGAGAGARVQFKDPEEADSASS